MIVQSVLLFFTTSILGCSIIQTTEPSFGNTLKATNTRGVFIASVQGPQRLKAGDQPQWITDLNKGPRNFIVNTNVGGAHPFVEGEVKGVDLLHPVDKVGQYARVEIKKYSVQIYDKNDKLVGDFEHEIAGKKPKEGELIAIKKLLNNGAYFSSMKMKRLFVLFGEELHVMNVENGEWAKSKWNANYDGFQGELFSEIAIYKKPMKTLQRGNFASIVQTTVPCCLCVSTKWVRFESDGSNASVMSPPINGDFGMDPHTGDIVKASYEDFQVFSKANDFSWQNMKKSYKFETAVFGAALAGRYCFDGSKTCFDCQGEATYDVTFQAMWSKSTFPLNYPDSPDFPNFAHFSELVGGSHSRDVSLWKDGGKATAGVQEVAELGGAKTIHKEMQALRNDGKVLDTGISKTYLNSGRGSMKFEVNVDHKHPLISAITMVAPSPDWMTGDSGKGGEDMCDNNGKWIGAKMVEAYAWDVGTDSGNTFTAADEPTDPHEAIHRIECGDYDAFCWGGKNIKPIGFMSYKLTGMTCPGELEYTQCGTACPSVCGEPDQEVCSEQCVRGCQCPEDTSRTKDDKCVPKSECPSTQECEGDLKYNSCGTACENICGKQKQEMCIMLCVEGCQCPQGKKSQLFKTEDNKCVEEEQCEGGAVCGFGGKKLKAKGKKVKLTGKEYRGNPCACKQACDERDMKVWTLLRGKKCWCFEGPVRKYIDDIKSTSSHTDE